MKQKHIFLAMPKLQNLPQCFSSFSPRRTNKQKSWRVFVGARRARLLLKRCYSAATG